MIPAEITTMVTMLIPMGMTYHGMEGGGGGGGGVYGGVYPCRICNNQQSVSPEPKLSVNPLTM